MKTIFTNFAPNTEADDARLALWLMRRPWRWRRGERAAALEDWFREYGGGAHAFAFDSGRTALFAILKSLNLTTGDEVLLQAYTCVAVPNPVIWAKLKPVYVDIDPATLTMSPADLAKKITPRSRALIIQHTFGNPAEIMALLKIARQHNLIVVEDCAHALGAKYRGQRVGTFGEAAFFSFGRDKVISSVFGGLAMTRRAPLAAGLQSFRADFARPSAAWIFQQLLHPVITYVVRVTYDFFSLGKMFYFLVRKVKLLSRSVYPVERRGQPPPFAMKKISNALAALALHQLAKLPRNNDHRQQIARRYDDGLADLPVKRVKTTPGSEPVWLRYVLLTPKARDLRTYAKRRQINLGDWYTQAIAPDRVAVEAIAYDSALCPKAEAASEQTVNLPTDVNITSIDADRIITLLKNYFRHGSKAD